MRLLSDSLIGLVLLWSGMGAGAATRGGGEYEVVAESLGGGGAEMVSSGDYAESGGFGGVTGVSEASAAVVAVNHGYGGQLYEITALRLTAPAATVVEHRTLQLSVLALLDDLTALHPPASAVRWSVESGPLTGISVSGLLTAGDVSRNTAASVRGEFAGLSAVLDLTVLNSFGEPERVPDIVVEQPAGTELFSGGLRGFGTVTEGSSGDLTFLLGNSGNAPLTGVALTFSGPDAERFSAFHAPGSAVAAGEHTEFVIRFTPSGGGVKTAELRLASNDPDENPFVIHLTGNANRVPVFTGYSFSTTLDRGVAVAAVKLLALVSDPDGDPVTITTVSAATSAGGAVSLGGREIFYQPPAGYTGGDSFGVTFSDGRGGAASGTVNVSVMTDNAPAGNAVSLEFPPGGGARGVFAGVPGRVYQVQRSTDLNVWTLVLSVTATELGEIVFTDASPPEGRAFYRTRPAP